MMRKKNSIKLIKKRLKLPAFNKKAVIKFSVIFSLALYLILTMFFLNFVNGESTIERINDSFKMAQNKVYEKENPVDISDFIKSDFNSEYGVIKLSNSSGKVAEYSLIDNTDYCLTDCLARGKATLYEEGILFENIKFLDMKNKNHLKELQYTYYIGNGYKEVITDVCIIQKPENITESVSSAEDICSKETHQEQIWKEYKGDILKPGNYEWKIEGTKLADDSIDWVVTSFGIDLTEWAVWTDSLTVGLTGYWGINEGSGTNVKEEAFGKNNGTMYMAGWYAGKNGTSVNITTNYSDAIIVPASACNFSLDQPFTLGFWINRSTYTGATDRVVLGKYGKAGNGWRVGQYLRTTGGGNWMVQFLFNNNSQGEARWANRIPTTASGKWEFYTFTYNGSGRVTGVKFYINGTDLGLPSAKVDNVLTTINNLQPFRIGNGTDADAFLSDGANAKLDEVMCFNRTLSGSEITSLWNNGDGIFYFLNKSYGTLEVNITSPLNNSIWYNGNSNLTINATVTCKPTGSDCGTISAFARYNASSITPDTLISVNLSGLPFFVNSPTEYVNQTNGFSTIPSGNGNANGIYTNGSQIWVLSYEGVATPNFVNVYDMNGNNLSNGFYAASDNNNGVDLTSNGSDFWIVENVDDKVCHYNSTGGYIECFATTTFGSDRPSGIAYDKSTNRLWVVDSTDEFVYNVSLAGVNGTGGFSLLGAVPSPPDDFLGLTTNGSDFWTSMYATKFVYHLNRMGVNQSDGFSTASFADTGPVAITINSTDMTDNRFWILYLDEFVGNVKKQGQNPQASSEATQNVSWVLTVSSISGGSYLLDVLFNSSYGDTLIPSNNTPSIFINIESVDNEYPQFSNYWDNNGTYTFKGNITLNVTATSTNGTVWVQFNNTNYSATNNSGNSIVWNVTILNYPNGTYYYNWSAYGNGTRQNFNYSLTRDYTILDDVTPPDINITFPQNNSNWSVNTINVNYTASDSGIGLFNCWYSNDSYVKNTTLTDCGTNITNIVWSEGQHNVTVWANDSIGNINSSTITFTIDTVAPSVEIIFPSNNSNSSNNNLDVNYTVYNEFSSCWYSNDTFLVNTTLTNCINVTEVVWINGQHNVTIWVNDSLGNENSSSVTFTVDTVAPDIIIFYPLNNTNTTNIKIDVNYTVSDTVTGVESCWYSNDSGLNNNTLASCTNITGVFWLEGINNVTIWVNDSVGNNNVSYVSFFIDTLSPYFTFIPSNISINYTQGFGVDFNASDDGIGFGNFAINYTTLFLINQSGWFTNSTSNLAVGSYYINVTINDSVNNLNSTIYLVNISKTDGLVYAYINNSRVNYTGVEDSTNLNVWLNATLISGVGNIELWFNGTLYNNGTSPISNLTNLSVGSYNITAKYSGNENYTSDDEVWNISISSAPVVTAPSGGSTGGTSATVVGNVTFYNVILTYDSTWNFNTLNSIKIENYNFDNKLVDVDDIDIIVVDSVNETIDYSSSNNKIGTGIYEYKYLVNEQNITKINFVVHVTKDNYNIVKVATVAMQSANVQDVLKNEIKENIFKILNFLDEHIIIVLIVVGAGLFIIIVATIISKTSKNKGNIYKR